jgi:long-chain acyl-CoA synthetase
MIAKMTLPEKFFEQAAKRLDQKAFYYCRTRDHKWVSMTWKRYREEVSSVAEWLLSQGVGKGSKVGIISANRPEWLIADLAIMSIGAVSVPVYATSSAGDVTYIIEHSEAEFLCVDTLERIPFLDKVTFKGIVTFDRCSKKQVESFRSQVTSLATILHETKPRLQGPVAVDFEDLATIIYTSGTTGKPKGVVHSHGNLAEAMKATYGILEHPEKKPDRYFSFLPLSHVAERIMVEVGSIQTGSEVAFARSIDTLGDDLLRCRPTILLCVPRLWEKIHEKIQAGLLTASPLKRLVFQAARALGEKRIETDHIVRSKDQSLPAIISDTLVGKKLREKLGLDRARMLVTGAAPTRPEVMRFFGSFGMMIREVYGLTENLCLGVFNEAEQIVIGSCGKPFPGNEMRLAEDGEIFFRAPWLFKGYYKNPEASHEVLDADGWFATGDLGTVDADGRLRIVGRKKELLKTSGGKYIAPVPIEDSLKSLPLIKEAMVVGDARKYCIALLALDEEYLKAIDLQHQKDELKKHLKHVNEPLSSYETIKRVGVIKEGFSVENGCLTPTLKVKRNVVAQSKSDFIEKLYRSEEAVIFEV